MASIYAVAVQQELQNQPSYLRYKGTILIITSGVASILAQLADSPDLQDTALSVGLTATATIIVALINRFTRDGVTPSMGPKLERAGMEAHLDRVSISTPPEEFDKPDESLPVYHGPTTAEA